MKEIIYEDCNNNIQFIKEMFLKIGLMVKEELMWNISNFDSVPVNSEDYSGVGRTVNDSRQRVYLFQQRILNEHTVVIGIAVYQKIENVPWRLSPIKHSRFCVFF